ncbi:hypothetical protein L0F51_04090 [Afifella sp. H1R]|uniref:hypothetical protein n=1 Tax=Afifella sp. H1R TaxID=2908841 RepID=UPI001F428B11|nr:hypothetical protein [Afifella sp. H1R]MCF1502945.1 hypothetical protein [Afifella sp. H1R]
MIIRRIGQIGTLIAILCFVALVFAAPGRMGADLAFGVTFAVWLLIPFFLVLARWKGRS